MNRPSALQYVGYAYGRKLPSELHDWVRNDLAGRGAVRRHMIRAAIPPFLVLAPFWLLNSGNAAWIHTNLQPQLVLPIHAGADAPAGVRRAPGQTYRVEAR